MHDYRSKATQRRRGGGFDRFVKANWWAIPRTAAGGWSTPFALLPPQRSCRQAREDRPLVGAAAASGAIAASATGGEFSAERAYADVQRMAGGARHQSAVSAATPFATI
jgi:hypothetical protein